MFSEDGADSEDPETFHVLQGTKGLFPIYPQTKDLDSWDLQRMVTFARSIVDDLPELLPADVRGRHGSPDARTALDWIHAPTEERVLAAQRRFRWEERAVTQLVLARDARRSGHGAQARTGGGGLLARSTPGCLHADRGPARGGGDPRGRAGP